MSRKFAEKTFRRIICAVSPFLLFFVGEINPCRVNAQLNFGQLAEEKPTEKSSEKPPETGGETKPAPKPVKKPTAKNQPTTEKTGSPLSTAKNCKFRFGMEFEARPGGECENLFGSVAVPMEYPEQKIRILEEEFPAGAKTSYRDLKEGGCRELIFQMKTLHSGQKIEVSVVFEITRFAQTPPTETANYKIPKRPDKGVSHYLKESPLIEIRDKNIRKLAADIASSRRADWDKVEGAFREVRTRIRYDEAGKEKPVRGAIAALESGVGDCEDMTALFIALCRNMEIPARTVRVPEHCWAEFYLEDADGTGYWFPAQVAGTEPLGSMQDLRPILQKGDAFNLPQSPRETKRYVTEFFTGDVKKSGADPLCRFIQEEIPR